MDSHDNFGDRFFEHVLLDLEGPFADFLTIFVLFFLPTLQAAVVGWRRLRRDVLDVEY